MKENSRLFGKILICHNAIYYLSAMEDYLEFIKRRADFETVILSRQDVRI